MVLRSAAARICPGSIPGVRLCYFMGFWCDVDYELFMTSMPDIFMTFNKNKVALEELFYKYK